MSDVVWGETLYIQYLGKLFRGRYATISKHAPTLTCYMPLEKNAGSMESRAYWAPDIPAARAEAEAFVENGTWPDREQQ